MVNNPYINKVKNDLDIICDTNKIYSNKGNWNKFFQNNNPIYLEIGTGLGSFFSKEVINNPNINYIGMEIRYKRLFKTAEKSRKSFVKNFVVIKDYAQNIDKIFSENELNNIYIFFPDPWDKKNKQQKNKLLQENFLNKLNFATKKGGILYFKTDHKGYFDNTINIIKKLKNWKINFFTHDYEKESEYFSKDKITEFESFFRGEKLKINYAIFLNE